MENKAMHWLLGGSLVLVFAIAVATIFVYSQAGDTGTSGSATSTASIANTPPASEDITVNVGYTENDPHKSALDLALGATKEVHVWGSVSDDNGYDDIDTVDLVFYRTGVGDTCSDDKNDCYSVTGCSLSAGSGLSKTYDCTINLEYYTDGTQTGGAYPSDDWTAKVTVTDKGASSASQTNTTEVNTLLGLNIPTAIAYGSFGLGASTTASTNQEMVITQKGNDEADVEVSGVAMTCDTIGEIPVGNQQWSLTDVDHGGSGTANLTGTAADTELHVAYRTDDVTPNTKTLYWNIVIPDTGVKGLCTGTNTIGVIAQ